MGLPDGMHMRLLGYEAACWVVFVLFANAPAPEAQKWLKKTLHVEDQVESLGRSFYFAHLCTFEIGACCMAGPSSKC